MNEEFLKLRPTSRKLILNLLRDDICNYSEVFKPTIDYDQMKHLLPLDKLDLHYNGKTSGKTWNCLRNIFRLTG